MDLVIISLVRDRVAAARLAVAARPLAAIEVCGGTEGALRSAAARLEVAAVILDVDLPDGRPTTPLIAALRARHPTMPVIVYARLTPETAKRFLEAAKAGATEFVLRDHDDDVPSFRALLRAAMAATFPVRCAGVLLADLPAQVRPIVTWCVTNARAPLAVEGVARGLRLDRSTIYQRLRVHRLPPVHVVIAWSRLLHVAHRLETPGGSVAQIAAGLRFPSATALHNQVRRYTGYTPQALREYGAVRVVVSGFSGALKSGQTAERVVALSPPAGHGLPDATGATPQGFRAENTDIRVLPGPREGDARRRTETHEQTGEAGSG